MSNAFDTTAWAGELVDLAGAVEAMAAQLVEDTPEEQLLGRVSQVLRQRQAPPFDGEIYWMIRRLSRLARMLDFIPNAKTHGMDIHRVIELLRMQSHVPAELERLLRAAATAVPVNERPWEQRGWCDDDGFCWLCNHYSTGRWNYDTPHKAGEDFGPLGNYTHSLPHWFIPRPRPTGRTREGAG